MRKFVFALIASVALISAPAMAAKAKKKAVEPQKQEETTTDPRLGPKPSQVACVPTRELTKEMKAKGMMFYVYGTDPRGNMVVGATNRNGEGLIALVIPPGDVMCVYTLTGATSVAPDFPLAKKPGEREAGD